MSRSIDYGNLMHDAMRSLIRQVLTDVADNGLPGAHHFFITFDTMHPEVELADWLSDRFPEDMTVVMQHWFEDLDVSEDGFAVTLNFGDNPERMYIPFDAIRTFVDPSVEFGLRFETQDDDDDEEDEVADIEDAPRPVREKRAEAKDDAPKDAEVVSLDSFRK
ncbi:MAG: ClpXP protease specificity-enhancing factor SspB [Pseudomonadota bacterium]|nr:ClpXP protease specificity-enhancing factor SspB [Pseudomonadota bacterium]